MTDHTNVLIDKDLSLAPFCLLLCLKTSNLKNIDLFVCGLYQIFTLSTQFKLWLSLTNEKSKRDWCIHSTPGLHLGFDDWYGLEILQNLKLEILQKIMRDFRQI